MLRHQIIVEVLPNCTIQKRDKRIEKNCTRKDTEQTSHIARDANQKNGYKWRKRRPPRKIHEGLVKGGSLFMKNKGGCIAASPPCLERGIEQPNHIINAMIVNQSQI